VPKPTKRLLFCSNKIVLDSPEERELIQLQKPNSAGRFGMNAMKTFFQILFAALLLMAADSTAQVYNILHNFGITYRDGYAPLTDLVLGSNTR
jgi:hypothetical protein